MALYRTHESVMEYAAHRASQCANHATKLIAAVFWLIGPTSLNDHRSWHVLRCCVSGQLLSLFGDGQLPSSFVDDLFAIGSRNVLLHQLVAGEGSKE